MQINIQLSEMNVKLKYSFKETKYRIKINIQLNNLKKNLVLAQRNCI